jgi:ribosomal protein L35AE/L33A
MTPSCPKFRGLSGLLTLLALATAPALASGPGVVKLDPSSSSASEGATVQVVVERSQGEDGAASVRVTSSGGSATSGADYVPVDVTLHWASGDGGDRVVAVQILDDATAEGAETINLTLTGATGASIDASRAQATITIGASDGGTGGGSGSDDGNGTFKFDERSYFADEGVGTAIITVERSHGERGEVSVAYATRAGSATAGTDYTEVSGTLTWAAGDEGIRSFAVPILKNAAEEPNETVELLLSNPTGGAAVDPVRGAAVLTILDDGGPADDGGTDDNGGGAQGVIKFDERSFEVIEGRASAVVTVERSRGERGAVSVQFATSAGSATAGVDYQETSGTLSWADGDESDKRITIPILDDSQDEGSETINLRLSNPAGGAVLDADRDTSVVQILDDDGSTAPCSAGTTKGCAQGNRFAFEATYRTSGGLTGRGTVVPLPGGNSATIWFFDPANPEILVKVLDACAFTASPAYWVFFAATTNVDFTLRVNDTHTGLTKEYKNLLNQAAAPVQDVDTFKTCGQ